MKLTLQSLFLLLGVLFISTTAISQTLNDGPIQLRVKVGEVRVAYTGNTASDVAIACGSFCNQLAPNLQEDELTFNFWAQDNANVSGLPWQGGFCLTQDLAMSSGGPDITNDFDTTIFLHTYTGASVAQFVNIRQRSWEDDIPEDFSIISGLTQCGSSGSRCTYESNVCCLNLFGCVFSEGDDYLCDANPFKTGLNYRLGPPCQTYSHGFITGSGCTNNFYRPEIKTFWRYTKGTSCSSTAAIDLGAITSGVSVNHFNSNECYGNNYTGGGNDVFYTFTTTAPMGITIRLTSDCPFGGGSFNTKLVLLNGSCAVDSTRNGTCSSPAIIAKALCTAGRYYVVVDGATVGDLGTFTLTVEENPSFSLNASVATVAVKCTGNSNGSVKVNVTGGVPPYTYQWSGGLPAVDSIGGLAAGPYSVTVSDAAGCQTTATGTIGSPAPLTATTTATNVSCGGATDGTATVTPVGGQTPYSYLWGTSPQPQNGATAISLPAGTYTVTVTDFNLCTTTATATVQPTTTVIVTTLPVSNVNCNGANDGAIDIEVTGGQIPYVYAWTNSLPATQDQTGLAPGNYTVTITDNSGCFETRTFVITEPALLTSSTSVRDASCQSSTDGAIGLSVLGGTSPYSYLWSEGTTTEELFGAAPGTYDVTITDSKGCTATNSATVSGPADSIVSSIAHTDANCATDVKGTATLTITGGTAPYSFFWSNFTSNQNVSDLKAGTYSVVITDGKGCVKIDTVTIAELAPGGSCGNDSTTIPRDSSAYVAIPNAFTPNNDGKNDIFQFWLNKTSNVEVFIFNRFGSQVYYKANQTAAEGWNGEHSGTASLEGTYVYMVNIVYDDGTEEQKTGSITLIR